MVLAGRASKRILTCIYDELQICNSVEMLLDNLEAADQNYGTNTDGPQPIEYVV